MKKKVAILTSGGDAPGMNACVRAVVRYGMSMGLEIWGVEDGYEGLVSNRLKKLNQRSVSDIIQRGGTFLKTARCKDFPSIEVQKKAVDNLLSRGIKNLIVIGGDGSFRGASALSNNFDINVVGIPGTIDNDLAYTDYTIGFDTAVNNVLWAINSLRDTMQSHDKVTMIEVMGRHCGDIALYAGITGGAEYILVPEVKYDFDKIIEEICSAGKRGKKSIMIVVAEGAGNVDELGKYFEEKTGIQARKTRLGHIQRGGSPTGLDRLMACKMAAKAVDLIKNGETDKIIGVKNGEIFDISIDEGLKKEKKFDFDLYNIANKLQ